MRPVRVSAARLPEAPPPGAVPPVAGGTAALARAGSGTPPEQAVKPAVEAGPGIAAEATAGGGGASGLAAPAGAAPGPPSPAPSCQVGAAPAYGQAGAAPCSEQAPHAFGP